MASTLNATEIGLRLKAAHGTDKYEAILGFIVQNSDLSSFEGHQVRFVYRHVWPFFLALCVIIIVFGSYVNARYFLWILRTHGRPSHVFHIRGFAFLINGIICDLLKALVYDFLIIDENSKLLVVFPLSIGNLLLRFYRLGMTVCYLLPLLQYLTIYVPILIYLAIALECSRAASLHRVEWRIFGLPVVIVSLIIWIIACCLVIPYPPFLHYVDIGDSLGSHFDGIGVCAVHKSDRRVTEVIRIAFVILFVAPLAAAGYLTMTSEAESQMNIMFQRSLSTRATASTSQASVDHRTHRNGRLKSEGDDFLPANTEIIAALHEESAVRIKRKSDSDFPDGPKRSSTTAAAAAARKDSSRGEEEDSDRSDDDDNNLQDAEYLNRATGEARRGPEVRLSLYKCHADGTVKRFTANGERVYLSALARMIAFFALLNLPLQLLMVLHYLVPHASDAFSGTSRVFDYLYLAFVPLAFLSTLINPLMVGATLSEQKSCLAFAKTWSKN